MSIKQHQGFNWGIRNPTADLEVGPADDSCLTLPSQSYTGDVNGECALLLEKRSCTWFKTSRNSLSVMSPGKVNTRKAVAINQVEPASPVFANSLVTSVFVRSCSRFGLEKAQGSTEEFWKFSGRSSIMVPPGDHRGYSVLWVSSTGICPSSKKGFIGELCSLQQYLN